MASAQTVQPNRVEKRQDERRYRWAMREHAREYCEGGRGRRVASCGQPYTAELALHRKADDAAFIVGHVACGSVWSCPVCAAKIRQRRAEQLSVMAAEWRRRGGRCWLFTVTVPHHATEWVDGRPVEAHMSLRALRSTVTEAWRRFCGGSGWKAVKKAQGIHGWWRSLEVTYGRNGWHPHLHVVLFTDGEPDRRELVDRWASVCGHMGLEVADIAQDLRELAVGDEDRLAGYVTKASVLEATRSDLKRAGKGLAPWQLLERAVEGDRRCAMAFREWADGMAGARAFGMSKGLAADLGSGDVTDEELAQTDEGGDLVVALPWDAPWWWLCDAMDACETGGELAVAELLRAWVKQGGP